jgi:UDP-N-acetylglucosamine:LPS N-acetylglucosamine transferase
MPSIEGVQAGKALGEKPVALTVLSGGGFTFETKRLLHSLSDQVDFVYLTTEFGGEPGHDGLPLGPAHRVPSFGSFTRPSCAKDLAAFTATFRAALKLISSNRLDGVIVVGCSHSIPILLAAKLWKKRSVFVESVARTDSLSTTGKIIYYLGLCSTFIVQWDSLRAVYRRAEVGTII